MPDNDDCYAIAANVYSVDKALRRGAHVWIVMTSGSPDRVSVFGMSRSGRNIEKYVATSSLCSFRVKWLPDHLRERIISSGPRADMEDRLSWLLKFG